MNVFGFSGHHRPDARAVGLVNLAALVVGACVFRSRDFEDGGEHVFDEAKSVRLAVTLDLTGKPNDEWHSQPAFRGERLEVAVRRIGAAARPGP